MDISNIPIVLGSIIVVLLVLILLVILRHEYVEIKRHEARQVRLNQQYSVPASNLVPRESKENTK